MRNINCSGRIWEDWRASLIAAAATALVSLTATPSAGAEMKIASLNPRTVSGFIDDFAKRNPDDTSLVFGLSPEQRRAIAEVASAAAGFRAAMAAKGREPVDSISGKNIELFNRSLELNRNGPPPALWRSFFQGTVLAIGHALAPVKRTGFYNPLVDGWIIADWSAAEKGLTLVGVRAVPGDVLRGQPADDTQLPQWTRMAGKSAVTALAETTKEAMRGFEKRYPLASAQAPLDRAADRTRSDRLAVESRLGVMLRSLAVLGQPDFASATRSLLESVDSGDPRQLRSLIAGEGPTSAAVHRVSGLLTPIRSQIRPTGVVRRSDGVTVLFGVPTNGRWLLTARYRPGGEDRALELQSIAFIDLIAADSGSVEQ